MENWTLPAVVGCRPGSPYPFQPPPPDLDKKVTKFVSQGLLSKATRALTPSPPRPLRWNKSLGLSDSGSTLPNQRSASPRSPIPSPAASHTPLFTASLAESEKKAKYSQICQDQGLGFRPFGVECLGALVPSASSLLSEIFPIISSRNPSFRPSSAFQHLSILLQSANVSAILSRSR